MGGQLTVPSRATGFYLLIQFREFYREVARLKRMVAYAAPVSSAEELIFTSAAATAIGTRGSIATLPAPGPSEASPAVTGVWQQLVSLLERQSLEAGQGGAFAYEVYREAQYVMAALADEIFLHLDWEGRSRWTLLESELFHSHAAGEVFFQRVEDLLRQRDP